MSADRKFIVDSITGWIGTLCSALALSSVKSESPPSTDPDFDGWIANDPMVTLNPASRYGDDATGFLAGSEGKDTELDGKDG